MMKKINKLSMIITVVALGFLSGCCFNPSHKTINVQIPVPTPTIVKPMETSTATITAVATSLSEATKQITIATAAQPPSDFITQVRAFIEFVEKETAILKATTAQMDVQIKGIKEQLETVKVAYDNEFRVKLADAGEIQKAELKVKDEEIKTLKEDKKIITGKYETEKTNREATDKIMMSTVSKSWSTLSWLGLIMLVGGAIATPILIYLKMSGKATAGISLLGGVFMITAGILPRAIVTANTAFMWICYCGAGLFILVMAVAAVMFVLNGNLHKLMDKWSPKIGADPRVLEAQEKSGTEVKVEKMAILSVEKPTIIDIK